MSRPGPDSPDRSLSRTDEDAATELFHLYSDRLIRLAHKHLPSKLARRVDPEDVVQSAFRSYFRRHGGRYSPDEVDELWHLLATITVNKARKTSRRHMAKRRTVESEANAASDLMRSMVSERAIANEPSPQEAAILIEETQQMMTCLTQLQRQIVQLRLQGYDVERVSRKADCSHRTVHRAFEAARSALEKSIFD